MSTLPPVIPVSSPVRNAWGQVRIGANPVTETAQLRDLVSLMGGDGTLVGATDFPNSMSLWRLREETTLLHEGAAAQTVYVVRSGSLKCLKTLEDGYEQVLSLAQPGDLLGFEALHCGRQPVTAVALEETTAYALPVRELARLHEHCPVLHRALQGALSRQLVRAAETTEMMAAVASDVRLARFLLWMSSRMAELGQSPRRLRLRMSRRDIASLLGVAHETVSRSFTTLSDTGYLKVDNREVELLDIPRLRARARITRGLDEASQTERQLSAARTAGKAAPWCPGVAEHRAGAPAAVVQR